MRMLTRMAARLGLAAAAGLALAGAALAQAPPVKLFTSSAIVEVDSAPLFLGKSLGFFEAEGVNVELGSAAGSAATLQLIASGQVEMGHLGMDVLILAKARNPSLPVTAVYLHYRGNIYETVVPEESDIRSIADLRDKNIGVANLASGAIPSLRASLADAGLNPDASVGLIPVGIGAQAFAALKGGRVQALALFRAQHAAIETLGVKFRTFSRSAPSTVIAVNSRFLEANRGKVVGVLRAVAAGSTFAELNGPATVRAFWAAYGKPQGLSDEEAMRRSSHVLARSAELWKRGDDPSTRWGAMSAADWDGMSRFLVAQKLLDKPVAAESLFTDALIDAVQAIDLGPVRRRAREAP